MRAYTLAPLDTRSCSALQIRRGYGAAEFSLPPVLYTYGKQLYSQPIAIYTTNVGMSKGMSKRLELI